MKKKYTMKDIAQACGVSTATVSYVLNDVPNQSISAQTKKRILQFANVVGYTSSPAAKALATGRSSMFGVYMPHPENSAGKHRLLRALGSAAEEAGCQLLLLTDRCLTQQTANVDAIFAVDVSEEEFAALGDNIFVPLLYLDGQTDVFLFYCVTFDADALRRRALERCGGSRAVLVSERPRCRAYAEYLNGCFDEVLTPEEARTRRFGADTVLVLTGDYPISARRALVLGSELPLDYAAYARTAVSTALKAIERDESPREHHIRI